MVAPHYCLELATVPGAFPLATQWVDITDYLVDFQWRYGRDDVLQQTQPGSGGVRVNNDNGEFSPANAAGLFSSYVQPMRAMRLRCTYGTGIDPFTRLLADANPRGWWRLGGVSNATIPNEVLNGATMSTLSGITSPSGLDTGLVAGDPNQGTLLGNALGTVGTTATAFASSATGSFTVRWLQQAQAGTHTADSVPIRNDYGTVHAGTYSWRVIRKIADGLWYGQMTNGVATVETTPGVSNALAPLQVALTYDGATLKLYFDDALVASVASVVSVNVPGGPAIVVGNTFPNYELQDITYHDAALTLTQLSDLYDAAVAQNYGMFYGYIQDATPQPAAADQVMPIQLADGFAWLARSDISVGYSPGSGIVGLFIDELLDAYGWPAKARYVDTGTVSINPDNYSGDAQTELNNLGINNEGGNVFLDPNGLIRFEDRSYRFVTATSTTSQGTFTGGDHAIPGELTDLQAPRPASNIINKADVVYAGGTATDGDATSQLDYGNASTSISTILSQADAEGRASLIVQNNKDPHDEPTASFVASGSAALLLACLGFKISFRITLHDLTVRTAVDGDFFIEAIEIAGSEVGNWLTCSWQCSDTFGTDLWELGVSTLGETTSLNP